MRKGFLLGGALLIMAVLAMITGFQPLYWLLYLVVGGAVISYLWAWLQSRGLETYIQELSLHPQVGYPVNVKVVVEEKAGFPRVGLRARLVGDFATLDEEDFSLPPHGNATWTMNGVCHRRGLNTVGSMGIVSGDPSGLLRLKWQIGQPKSILVYPATLDLTRTLIEGQAAGGEVEESGQLTGHSPTASMVRQYVPGDGLSRIHWPTTARLGHLMTKEFEGASINEIRLFVDLQEAVQEGTGEDGTEEYSITIAASLARALIQEGHAVGLVTQGDQFHRLLPSKDPNHIWAMLKALALVKAKGMTPLSTLITQESGNVEPGTVAIVIAPWPGQGIASIFQFLTRRGILVVPIFLNPASFGRASDYRWAGDPRIEIQDWTFVVRRGDELRASLGTVMDRLATY